MYRSNAQLKALYLHLNRKWFDNKLPLDLKVRWAKNNKEFKKECEDLEAVACAGKDGIIFSKRIPKKWARFTEFTMLHEMLHIKLPARFKHGKRFQAEMLRLAVLGAFKKLW